MKTSEQSEIIFMRLVNNLFTAYPTEDHMPPQARELVSYTRKRYEEIMNQKIKKDIREIEPKIGSIITFNPPKYKGLVLGVCVGFTDAGLPKLKILTNVPSLTDRIDYIEKQYYSPKTDFAIVQL